MAAMLAVTPTRMELLKLRRRVTLAQKGHDLLREKMDALVIEFFEVLKRVLEARAKAFKQLSQAYRSLSTCLAAMGTLETLQASKEVKAEAQLESLTRYVMGVPAPVLKLERAKQTALTRGYSLHTTSALLDEASQEFEKTLELLVELAGLEESARALARELEKTKRRVNALEYIIIPRLKEALRFITMRLEEMERENFLRLKRIKALLEARS